MSSHLDLFFRLMAVAGLVCVGGLVSGPTSAQGSAESVIEVQDCAVDFAVEVKVPALETGRVAVVNVAINDMVDAGAEIARLDDRRSLIMRHQAEVKHDSAKRKADDNSSIDYARSALNLARAELDASRAIQRESMGAVARTQVKKLELAVERGRAELSLAERSKEQAGDEAQVHAIALSLIDDQLRNLHAASPISGVVLEVTRSVGEWIERGDTIATVARIDVLHVRGFLSGDEISPAACRGLPVLVHWIDPISGNRQMLRGKVLSVDPQLRGGQFRLHAEIKNQTVDGDPKQWLLQPGADVNMSVYVSVAKRPQANRR